MYAREMISDIRKKKYARGRVENKSPMLCPAERRGKKEKFLRDAQGRETNPNETFTAVPRLRVSSRPANPNSVESKSRREIRRR